MPREIVFYADSTNTLPTDAIQVVNDYLNTWILKFQQAGNTLTHKNEQGNPYLTFAIAFLGKDLDDALALFLRDIDNEGFKTKFISVRQYPEMAIWNKMPCGQSYILRARLVSFNH